MNTATSNLVGRLSSFIAKLRRVLTGEQITAADAWERGENSCFIRNCLAWESSCFCRGAPLSSAVRHHFAPRSIVCSCATHGRSEGIICTARLPVLSSSASTALSGSVSRSLPLSVHSGSVLRARHRTSRSSTRRSPILGYLCLTISPAANKALQWTLWNVAKIHSHFVVVSRGYARAVVTERH